jgi:hypothetical protein
VHHTAVGSHHLGRQEVVAAQAIKVAEVAVPATQRQAADSRIRHHAAGCRKSDGLGCTIDVRPGRAASTLCNARLRVDVHAAQPGQINH